MHPRTHLGLTVLLTFSLACPAQEQAPAGEVLTLEQAVALSLQDAAVVLDLKLVKWEETSGHP